MLPQPLLHRCSLCHGDIWNNGDYSDFSIGYIFTLIGFCL